MKEEQVCMKLYIIHFICVLDLNFVWYKLPLKFEFLRLSEQLLCHMIRGKLLRSYVRDGYEQPYTIWMDVYGKTVGQPGFAHPEVAT